MNPSVIDYAVSEIQGWKDDALLSLALNARSLFKSVINSGCDPTDCPTWVELRQSLDVAIASNSDAWNALTTWDRLSGGEDLLWRLRDSDNPSSMAIVGIFAFAGRQIMQRFGNSGMLTNRSFADWKNGLCSSIQKYVMPS